MDAGSSDSLKLLVESYFNLGLSYRNIVSTLKLRNNVYVTERHLKRLLRSYGLRRHVCSDDVDTGQIADFIEAQLNESGRLHGYRWMYCKCQLAGFQVTREIVRQLCKHFDPLGVELKGKHCLIRRSYFARGPNYIWHLDSYDKIKPYGVHPVIKYTVYAYLLPGTQYKWLCQVVDAVLSG